MGWGGGYEQHGSWISGRRTLNALGAWIERGETGGEFLAERREVGLRDHQSVGDRGLARRLGEAVERPKPATASMTVTTRPSRRR